MELQLIQDRFLKFIIVEEIIISLKLDLILLILIN